VIATYAAYLEEDHFQHGNAKNLWIMGIVINSVLIASFIVPLSAIIGVCVQLAVERRQTQAKNSAAVENPKDVIRKR